MNMPGQWLTIHDNHGGPLLLVKVTPKPYLIVDHGLSCLFMKNHVVSDQLRMVTPKHLCHSVQLMTSRLSDPYGISVFLEIRPKYSKHHH